MKKETLKEAAERLQKDKYGIFISKDADIKGQLVIDTGKAAFSSGMIEGAKWQQEPEQFFNDDRVKTLEKGIEYLLKKQERMYSEEEVLEILFESSCNNDIDKKEMKEWFEQFKKK